MAVLVPTAGDAPPVLCQNAQIGGCNWLLQAGQSHGFCIACQHNHLVPDLSINANHQNWLHLELAKRKLFCALLRWSLPHPTKAEDPQAGLAFDFLADTQNPDGSITRYGTGHRDGVITLNLAEGNDVSRVERKSALQEPYRTVIGHLRHEIGHYYWNLLIADSDKLREFRALFGDERQDYRQSLQRHYSEGAPSNWALSYISAYATAHPWEDFAETWAHWMHIVDGLDTVWAYGLSLDTADGFPVVRVDADPYLAQDISSLIDVWVPLTVAVNNMNRGMGQPDLYPFVLSRDVVAKMRFINGLIQPFAARPVVNVPVL